MAELIERTTALVAWHGDERQVAEELRALGAGLPEMGRFVEAGGLLVARVAPRQVLAMQIGVDVPLMEELAPLAEVAGVIDLSDSRVVVRVSGAGAVEDLRRLVTLDLGQLEVGRCAQTLVAHLSVLVLRVGEDAFELQCGRSFGGSFLRAVDAACGV